MFFSVDVETSGLNPWNGELLTVGVAIVNASDPRDPYITNGSFYQRHLVVLTDEWYDESLPTENETCLWWRQQDKYVKEEAYLETGLKRLSTDELALMLSDWVIEKEPDYNQRFFVANPVGFDKMWIDWLFEAAKMPNPFHYRALCLRSMKYGRTSLTGDLTYGSERANHKPEIPHHAFYDAYAQAEDLVVMLRGS